MSQYSLGGDGPDSDSGGGMSLGGGGLGFGGGNGGGNDSGMGGGQGLGYGGTYGGGNDYGGGSPGYGLTDSSNFNFGGDYGPGGIGGTDYGLSNLFNGSNLGMTSPTNFADMGMAAPSMPTWNGMIGLNQTNLGKTGQGLDGNSPVDGGGFSGSDFAKRLRQMGLLAGRVNPNASRAMGVLGAAEAMGSGEYGQGLSSLASLGGVAGPVAGALGIGVNAMTNPTRTYSEEGGREVTVNANGMPSKTPGRQLADLGVRTITTAGGAALGGPFGAMLGSELGGWMNRQEMGPAGPTPSQVRGTEGNGGGQYQTSPQVQQAIASIKDPAKKEQAQKDPVGAIMGGLMGLYGINRMRNTAEGQQRQIQQNQEAQKAQYETLMAQFNGGKAPAAPAMRQPNFGAISGKLDAMFGPRSGVASELRTQLERKDAAAGRRSQYGPREVQLMAELTRLRAQSEPGYMNAEVAAANAANQGAFNIYNSQQQARQQQLQQMLAGMNMSNTGANNASNANYLAQQASDQRTQQGLALLYSMGRDTGFNNWVGNQASNWWNNGS